MAVDALIKQLLRQTQKATPDQLARIARHIAASPFVEDLLEVDEPLWGGFWQGDVIAPGYQLPAVELALLRAVRLDGHWPEGTTVAQYLADLRAAVTQPQAGVWLLTVADEPCVVIASRGNGRLTTVVWYCASTGRLHAGYRTANAAGYVEHTVVQRPGAEIAPPPARGASPAWLRQVVAHPLPENASTAIRLDREILKIRLAG